MAAVFDAFNGITKGLNTSQNDLKTQVIWCKRTERTQGAEPEGQGRLADPVCAQVVP
jgi:hypothetical protein